MIYELVNDCIEFETERGIGKTTLKELTRYLHEFADYCLKETVKLKGLYISLKCVNISRETMGEIL